MENDMDIGVIFGVYSLQCYPSETSGRHGQEREESCSRNVIDSEDGTPARTGRFLCALKMVLTNKRTAGSSCCHWKPFC